MRASRFSDALQTNGRNCWFIVIASYVLNNEHIGMSRLRNAVLNILLVALASALLAAQTGSQSARQAFLKIQNLAGKWQGQDEQGNAVKSEFVSVASNTAVMETLSMSGMEDMVTIYNVDMDSIALMHYCPTNNQPRMRAVPSASPVKQLVFAFIGAGNLPNTSIGHEQQLVLQFTDNDHITERWTWRKNNKDTEMVFHLARVSARASNNRR